MFQPIPFLIEFTEPELWFIGLALVLSIFDILTGWIQAIVNRSFSSTKMREGLWHKMMLVLIICLAVVLQGFTTHIGDTGWSAPLIYPVCAYIAVMEVASILENVKSAYPEIADSPLFQLFESHPQSTDEEA